jgi:solute:Na+ symporter, SSS family
MITTQTLSIVDWALIAGYLLFVTWLGIKLGGRHKGADDYFLAGRKMHWVFVGVSLFASNISSTTLIGLAGAAYATGISIFNYEWSASVILVFFAIFMVPALIRSKAFTMPEVLETRYGTGVRKYFSLLTIFLNIVVDTAGSLFAGGVILKTLFPETDFWIIISALALFAGIYTLAGGMAAVIYTDFVQTIFLLIGAVTITVVAFSKIGGWSHMVEHLDPARLSLIRPMSDPTMPWTGLLFGIPVLGFYFWCTNQFMTQRILSARSIEHAQKGALLAAALKLPVLFIMVIPGTIAIKLYPDLAQPDLVYPTLIFDLLPSGLLGIVLAGFLAALMSQIDSTLNAASTLVTMDFIQPLKPNLTTRQLMRTGRIVTFLFMLLAAAWAPQIQRFESLFNYLQQILAYAVPPVVALYLGSLFSKRANRIGGYTAIAFGTAVGAILFYLNVVAKTWTLHFLYVAPIILLFSLIGLVVGSSFAAGPPPAAQTMRWTLQSFRDETRLLKERPLLHNYRFWAILLLAATFAIVYWFR